MPHLSHRHLHPLSHLSQRGLNTPFAMCRMQLTSPLKIIMLAHFLSPLFQRNLSLHTKLYHPFIIHLSLLMSTIVRLTHLSPSPNANFFPFLLKSEHNLEMLLPHAIFRIRTLLSKTSLKNLLLTFRMTSLHSYPFQLFLCISINSCLLVLPQFQINSKLIFAHYIQVKLWTQIS